MKIPVLLALATLCAYAPAQSIPGGGAHVAAQRVETGSFPTTWISGGPACGAEPAFQIHAYNEDLYILRQSLCTNFEAPFLYLVFGSTRALLLDTGAGGVDVRGTVQGIVGAWLAAHGQASIQLVVAHLHPHGDHIAGDSQFVGQPNTTLVGTSLTSVRNFFGIAQWPTQIVPFDLGGRVLDVVPIPGHHAAHIALYDRRTGILFTGDSLLAGRLLVPDASLGNLNVYKASVRRLVDFTATRPLAWVLGTHVEMTTTPGQLYSWGSTYHPAEHVLQLERSHLLELDAALQLMTTPHVEVHDDFVIQPYG